MRAKLTLVAVIVAVAFAAGLFVAELQRREPVPTISGLLWPEPPVLAPFSLRDANGEALTEQWLQNRWTLIFFGFTHCPDICPTTLATLNQVYEQTRGFENLEQSLQVLFVSVDPERDSNENLRKYVSYFNTNFFAATGNSDELKQLTRQLGVISMKVDIPGQENYSMDHSASVLLIDPQLRFVGVFSAPHAAPDIVARLVKIVDFIGNAG